MECAPIGFFCLLFNERLVPGTPEAASIQMGCIFRKEDGAANHVLRPPMAFHRVEWIGLPHPKLGEGCACIWGMGRK